MEVEHSQVDLNDHIKDYDGIVKVECLRYIAANNPELALDAATTALQLMNRYNYGLKHYHFFAKMLQSTPGASQASQNDGFANLEVSINSQIKAHQVSLESITEALQEQTAAASEEEETDELVSITEQLRDTYFQLAVLYLATDDYQSASASLNIYVPNYNSIKYSFRDYERECFVAYVSGHYNKVKGYEAKLADMLVTSKKHETISDEEAVSYWKIKWAILMANFQLQEYNTVKTLFDDLINEKESTLEGVSAVQVLEGHFGGQLESDSEFSGNCYNHITIQEIKIAALLSTLISSSFETIKQVLGVLVFEEFFEKSPLFLEFVNSLIHKKFHRFEQLQREIEASVVRFTYNVSVSTWQHIKLITRLRLYLFYLSLVGEIGVAEMAQRVGVPEQELLQIVLPAFKILKLSVVYDPIQRLFKRIEAGQPALERNLDDLSLEVQAQSQSTMLQNLALKSLTGND